MWHVAVSKVNLGNNLLFSQNIGSIFVYSGEVTITGNATLSKNYQLRIQTLRLIVSQDLIFLMKEVR